MAVASDVSRADASKLRSLLVAVGAGVAGILVSVVLVFAVLLPLQLAGVSLSPTTRILVLLILNQYFSFGGVALAYLRYRGVSLREYVGVRFPSLRDVAVALGGLALTFALVFGASVVVQLLGTETASNQTAELGRQNPQLLLVLIPAAFLIIGPGEEILFRGVVQRRLREAFSAPVAILVAAALFAAIHYVALTGSFSARLASIAVLFLPSLVFGAAYEYTRNLVVSSFIHGAYDAVLFGLLYLVATSDVPTAVGPLPPALSLSLPL